MSYMYGILAALLIIFTIMQQPWLMFPSLAVYIYLRSIFAEYENRIRFLEEKIAKDQGA